MRALVTGATGFLGGRLVRELIGRGHEVAALVRPGSDATAVPTGAELVRGDVTDAASLAPAMAGRDVVFHLAAVVGRNPGGREHHRDVGLAGTEHVIRAAAAAGARRFVHLSSMVVHGRHPGGRPVSEDAPYDDRVEEWNHYAWQKIVSERAVWRAHEEGAILATTVRPPTVLGPGDPNLAGAMLAIMGSPLGVLARDGAHRMPVVVADELVPAIAGIAGADATIGRAYHLASTTPVTKDTLLGWFREAGLRPRERRQPVRAAMAAAALVRPPLPGAAIARLEAHAHRRAQHDCVLDCSAAAADLGWRGMADVRDAVRRTMDWHLGRDAGGPG
jgi:nucleoside-diphosphate-sugar epimerase